MDREAILAVYHKVSGVMDLMVRAAEAGDWDEVTELEPQCSAYVDVLRASDHHDGLTEDEREYKMRVIRKILEDDQRIRELATPWMRELSELIHHSVTIRKVSQAYHPQRF
ncbi:MAG: flagellar protein FliT [Burkholderiaceae bacterium]|jgi:flagellar protein FliT|nr:flagellar protein FliT [Burkholderiaceae bacterium]